MNAVERRRRADGKTDGRQDGSTDPPLSVARTKRTIILDVSTSRMLDVQAMGMGVTASALVESLIVAHCQDFELRFRGGGGR